MSAQFLTIARARCGSVRSPQTPLAKMGFGSYAQSILKPFFTKKTHAMALTRDRDDVLVFEVFLAVTLL